jgi:hemerythrin
VEWTPDLSVGVELIDEQHRELFRRITRLVEAVKSKECKYVIGDVMQFLREYVVEHFGEEQAIMEKYGYPASDAHRAEHERFMEDFSALEEELRGETSSYTRSVYTNQMVVDWILNHIRTVDTRLGEYLRTRHEAG